MTRPILSDPVGMATPSIALTIAGSDSSGGAGIQADLKAFSALGVYGASVITAITAQNTRIVTDIHNVPTTTIAAQMNAVFDDLAVAAVKIGMLSTPETTRTVAAGLERYAGPVVLDPVIVAKSGAKLLRDDAVTALLDCLIPRATVLTPNLPEAAALLGEMEARDTATTERQGHALIALGAKAVLMKGGHAVGEECVDLLVTPDAPPLRLVAPRIDTRNTHGTGCTLSASIAAGLAKGLGLAQAVTDAHRYLHEAIKRADDLVVGSGHGPVHHFHQLWA